MKQKTNATIYLVDSENVNDVWIQLATVLGSSDEIVVFYTDKSPHMSYEKVIELTRLADRPICWVKCVAGNNALDFQLVTELGARVATTPENTFVIISNDTGFDAAVQYWVQRDKDVRRLKSAECKRLALSLRKADSVPAVEEQETDRQELQTEEEPFAYMEDIRCLSQSIPVNRLTLFHDAFVCTYDQAIGDEIYYYMKEHKTELAQLSELYLPKKKARLKNYFSYALAHTDNDVSGADAVMEIYQRMDEPKKSLQKINVEAVKKFGQEQGTGYYKVLRKHIKVMSKL